MKNKILIMFLLLANYAGAQQPADSLNYFLRSYQFKEALLWIDTQEETKENRFQAAMAYKALGENRKATDLLKSLSEEYPDDLNIKIELAQCYDRSSRWNESSEAYSGLAALDSTNIYFTIKKSEADINRKNYKLAISTLEESLKKDTLMNVIRLLGKSYESINKTDTAMDYYHLAWSTDSTDVFSAANLVNTALKSKYYLQAKAFSESFVKMDSTSKQMNMLYGYSLYALEEYEPATEVLHKCYLAGDTSLVVTRSLGMCFFYEGVSDSSYLYLKKAYEMDTTNSTILYNLAVSAGDIKEYEGAIVYHNKLLNRLIPSNMQLYLNYRGLAIGYENTEDYINASINYIKALEYATTDQRMHIQYALACLYEEKIGEKERALMYYNLYRSSLIGHLVYLKNNENSPAEIKETEDKLSALEEHIVTLGKKELEKRPDPSAQAKRMMPLFVVNGEIVEKLDDKMSKPSYQKVIYDFSYEGLSDEEKTYVKQAEKEEKEIIVIILLKEEAKLK